MKNQKTIFIGRRSSATTSVCAWCLASALALIPFLFASVAFAGSALWTAANGNWNLASNWNPQTVPNGSTDIATFYRSNTTAISLSASVGLADLVFNGDGYTSYTITIPGQVFYFEGAGITNNSGYRQNFIGNGNGEIEFFNSASAGDQTNFTVCTDNKTMVAAGSLNTYMITVTNTGLENVNGAIVTDTFPGQVQNVSYTATGKSGATGFSAGSGNINQSLNLPPNSSVTYKATGFINGNSGTIISNAANVSVPVGVSDPNTANNTVTDKDTIQ